LGSIEGKRVGGSGQARDAKMGKGREGLMWGLWERAAGGRVRGLVGGSRRGGGGMAGGEEEGCR